MRIGTLLLIVGLCCSTRLPRELGLLALVIPLVPIGTALLFPRTTSLMSRHSDPASSGPRWASRRRSPVWLGVAAPLLSTTAFQRLGHGWPFYIAGGYVALVGLMAFRIPHGAAERPPDAEAEEGARSRMSLEDRMDKPGAAARGVGDAGALAAKGRGGPGERTRRWKRRSAGQCSRRPAGAAPLHHPPSSRRPLGPPASSPPSPSSPPPLRPSSVLLREMDRPAGLPRHRGRRAARRGGLSAQALLRSQLDHSGDALPRRGRRGRRRRRDRVAAPRPLPDVRRRAHRGGAGIIYLSVWAAARLYGVLPSATGIVGLALVSVALAMIAYGINVEALGTDGRARRLLRARAPAARATPARTCCSSISPAWRRVWDSSRRDGAGASPCSSWRRAISVWASRARRSVPIPGRCCCTASSAAPPGLYLGLRERWWETRLPHVSGGWWLLAAANDRIAGALGHARRGNHSRRAGVVARNSVAAGASNPVGIRKSPHPADTGWSAGEALYFFVTPLLLAWALRAAAPERFDDTPGLVALVVAIPYLLAGYLRRMPPFAAVGAAAAAVAVSQHWEGPRRYGPFSVSACSGQRWITGSVGPMAGGTV